MRNKIQGEIKINKIKILIVLLTLTLTSSIIYFSFYYLYNSINQSYLKQVKKILNNAEQLNKDISKKLALLQSISIDDNTSIKNLISEIENKEVRMGDLIIELQNITPPEKYTYEHKKVIECINTNKKLLTQLRLIMNNLKSNKIFNAIDNFNKYMLETQEKYNNLKIAKIKLPSEFAILPNNLHTFAYKYYSTYEQKNRLFEQYQNYFIEMDKLINEFIYIKTDLNTYLDNIMNSQDSIYSTNIAIEKKLIKLEALQAAFSNLSIPEKLVNIHSKIDDIINSYVDYCKNFKETISLLSQTGSDQETLTKINQKFEEAQKSYIQITNLWIETLEEYNNQKQAFSDLNNL
ncbi:MULTISPECIES: hypothetical protein [Caloramator]|uniref:Uncharacterized protein n=1 Tax=Caloramator australicus RC3 TaxID=857293 RepID=G0V3I9_9CLOT|nr:MULTISPECIES: hypothetical protein [Caloramator]MDO6353724.1 hypothetical protein [Caloramator sp. CAR-1]CCC57679.1 hypothetical protein CAAU_0029 [Caloramator australicus RC3]